MLSLHYISRDEYNNADASSKTSDKLFFLSDTHEIFRGTENFTESVIFYDEEPTTKIAGKLYINQNTLVGRIWNGIDWITVAEPQVQSDYENNDNTSKSFILNRPFYDSRNTISRTYGFDGSTNGKTVLNTADANAKYIKVSDDLILNKDILVGGTLVSVAPNSEGAGTEESSISIDQVYTINANESGKYVYALVSSIAPYVLVAKEDCSFIDVYSSDSSSINITAGVYFLYQAADNYVKSLTFSYESGELKTIDPKFIPWESSPAATSVLYTEQTLTDEQKAQARMNIEACDRTHEYIIVEGMSNLDNDIDLLDSSSEYSTIGSIIQLKALAKIFMKNLIYTLTYGHAETYDSVLSVNTYDNNLNFDATYEYSTSDTGYSTISAIDANNYKCTLKIRNVDCFEVYFIANTSTLTEEYSSSFSATGVYLKYLAAPSYASQYLRIKFKVLQYYKLSDHYLGGTVERTKNKVTAISDSVTDDQYPSALSVKTELDKTIKITEQTLTDEQKSQARTNIGAGGLQVQSDYTQNDNTQTDYIKNRPFYEDTLIDVIWDGNTTGKTEVDLTSALGFNVYLVSDATPSAEDLIGATLSIYTGSDTMEIPLGSEYVQTISDNIILLAEGYVFVVLADNSEYNGITFPSKGTYLVSAGGSYVSGITKKAINKIDPKFIPNGIDTLKITVTYNSSTDTYSADKTSDDIKTCLDNGGIPYVYFKSEYREYTLTSYSADLHCYCFSNEYSSKGEIDIYDSGDVTVVEHSKFSNLEYTNNKVTAIDNTATNYQYPSALAVKTALDGKLDASHFIIDSNNNITGIKIKDQVNDYNYILRVKDGTFTVVRADAIVGIKVTTNPTKMSYNAGDYIDTTGMVVSAECEDGTLREIIDYTCDNYVTVDNPVFTITYTENNVVYSTGLTVNVTAFDPSVVLADFTYTDNGDGTYTITGWNGTYNGVTSTELIIPDNAYIIL